MTIAINRHPILFYGLTIRVDGEYERWTDETESTFTPEKVYIFHPFSMGCSMEYDLTEMFDNFPQMKEELIATAIAELDKRSVHETF